MNSWKECCHEITRINITKTPVNPHDELPIRTTHEGSEDGGDIGGLKPFEEVVRMAIISPATTIGTARPNPIEPWFRKPTLLRPPFAYNGERMRADTKANTMAIGLWEDELRAAMDGYAKLVRGVRVWIWRDTYNGGKEGESVFNGKESNCKGAWKFIKL